MPDSELKTQLLGLLDTLDSVKSKFETAADRFKLVNTTYKLEKHNLRTALEACDSFFADASGDGVLRDALREHALFHRAKSMARMALESTPKDNIQLEFLQDSDPGDEAPE